MLNDDDLREIGVTFDDVLLEPQYSETVPSEVDLKTKLTDRITLNVPFMSAPMDTVTESQMAIALAQEGGFYGVAIVVSHHAFETDFSEAVFADRKVNLGVCRSCVTEWLEFTFEIFFFAEIVAWRIGGHWRSRSWLWCFGWLFCHGESDCCNNNKKQSTTNHA